MTIDQAKQAVRDMVWRRLLNAGVVPPDVHGTIPIFDGANVSHGRTVSTRADIGRPRRTNQ
ncbi:hypothetical protein HTZ77_13545 [Nonomuraea sp. SMC257]|uniref:Uncharacterized protein n=1 Tax=Nonomuraea montanisoli TaxID=2741721 RepID=A0A7Y6M3F8_9ACTN|nr:hypothetical protein [Nonomuraea montanisoli]NUW32446.1 hypothetical protein [Nonomuraea montanisoli]